MLYFSKPTAKPGLIVQNKSSNTFISTNISMSTSTSALCCWFIYFFNIIIIINIICSSSLRAFWCLSSKPGLEGRVQVQKAALRKSSGGENQLSAHPQAPSTKQTHFLIEAKKNKTLFYQRHGESKIHKERKGFNSYSWGEDLESALDQRKWGEKIIKC